MDHIMFLISQLRLSVVSLLCHFEGEQTATILSCYQKIKDDNYYTQKDESQGENQALITTKIDTLNKWTYSFVDTRLVVIGCQDCVNFSGDQCLVSTLASDHPANSHLAGV